MRVNRLYIAGDQYDNNAETKNVCEGLFTKYSARCGRVTLHKGNPPQEVKNSGDEVNNGPYAHEVGFYGVFHNLAVADLEMAAHLLSGEEYVQQVIRPALGDDFTRLGRVVFVACMLAPSKRKLKTEVAGKTVANVQDMNERGFLLSAALALNEAGVRPKIIGWDSFISALPYQPKDNTLYAQPKKKNKKDTGLSQDEIAIKTGSKIGHGSRYGLVSESYRAEHKRTLWIKDGTFHVADSEGWSL